MSNFWVPRRNSKPLSLSSLRRFNKLTSTTQCSSVGTFRVSIDEVAQSSAPEGDAPENAPVDDAPIGDDAAANA